jgi:hypothetical protein
MNYILHFFPQYNITKDSETSVTLILIRFLENYHMKQTDKNKMSVTAITDKQESLGLTNIFELSESSHLRSGMTSREIGLELCCLMPLSTIFHLYRGGQFFLWRKPPTCHKSLTTPNVVSSTPQLIWVQTYNVRSDRHRLHRYL